MARILENLLHKIHAWTYLNTGEVGDNGGDNSFRACEVNTVVNVAAQIDMLGDLIFLYLKARCCKYYTVSIMIMCIKLHIIIMDKKLTNFMKI